MAVLSPINKYRKRGLSEMVSYALLVAIAIGLSVGVFFYLKLYVPKERPECSQDISLLIKEAKCDAIYSTSDAPVSKTELSLTIYNNGLHKVDAAYIRFDKADKSAKAWINDPSKVEDEKFYFYNPRSGKRALLPGEETIDWKFDIDKIKYTDGKKYILEVQPAVFSNNLLSACKFTLSQEVECKKIVHSS